MLQATEIRQGNWVKENLSFKQIDYRDHDYFHVEQFEPIPLTAEILEKAGFVNNSFKQYELLIPETLSCVNRVLYFSGDYLYLEEPSQRRVNSDLIAIWNKDLMKEFYLHQLQNLYFALTGIELEINLNEL